MKEKERWHQKKKRKMTERKKNENRGIMNGKQISERKTKRDKEIEKVIRKIDKLK